MNENEIRNVSKLAKNSLWAGVGSYGGLFFIPISSLIATRILGVEDYGIYGLIQGWGSFLSGLCALGIIGTNLRFIPIYKGRNEFDKIKGSIYFTLRVIGLVGFLVALMVFLFPNFLCEMVLKKPTYMAQEKFDSVIIPAFRFYALTVLLTPLYQSVISSLTGLQAIRYKVIANDLLAPLVKTIFLVLFLLLGWKVYGALAANLIQDGFILGCTTYFLVKVFPGIKDAAVRPVYEIKKILKFSAALFSDALLNKYTFQLDILFLGYYGELSNIGVYTIAMNLTRIIYMSSYAVMSILGPMCGELYAKGDIPALAGIYKTSTKWTASVSLPLFFIYTLFPNEILAVFGKGFTAGKDALVTLAFGNLVADSLGMAGVVILATGRAKLNFINSVMTAVSTVSCYLILIPRMGMMGAAIAYVFSQVLINTIRHIEVWVLYKITPFKWSIVKPIAASVAAAAMVLALRYLLSGFESQIRFFFVAYILIFILLYAGITYLLGLDAEDKIVLDLFRKKLTLKKTN